MSDKIKGFYVVLDKDIRDEDFERIENVVLMIKNVLSVKRSVSDSNDWMNRERIKQEIINKIYNTL